jgi:hypothetical protein
VHALSLGTLYSRNHHRLQTDWGFSRWGLSVFCNSTPLTHPSSSALISLPALCATAHAPQSLSPPLHRGTRPNPTHSPALCISLIPHPCTPFPSVPRLPPPKGQHLTSCHPIRSKRFKGANMSYAFGEARVMAQGTACKLQFCDSGCTVVSQWCSNGVKLLQLPRPRT